jgi:hypothetical protein
MIKKKDRQENEGMSSNMHINPSTLLPIDKSVEELTATTCEDSAITLFESVSRTPNYEENRTKWDRLLRLLHLDLRYQPAVAKVLAENRWRTVRNPRAYVATAAVRQGKAMRLPDYLDSGFKVIRNGSSDPDKDHRMDVTVDANGNDRPTCEQERYDNKVHAIAMKDGWYDRGGPNIPKWLQLDHEYDAFDWETVARHAALKPAMVRALALTLKLRYEDNLTREQAVSLSGTSGLKIEAAWKWIDRNAKDRIAPLLRMEEAPKADSGTTRDERPVPRFIPPGKAIKKVCSRAGEI